MREDTRLTFTSHLHAALKRASLEAFIDDKKLEKGDEIPASLSQAIKDSSVSLVVFSQNYASSKWCLDELAHIMQYSKEKHQSVIPIFYNVDPSHVRNQAGPYKEAFDQIKNQGKTYAEVATGFGLTTPPHIVRMQLLEQLSDDQIEEIKANLIQAKQEQNRQLIGAFNRLTFQKLNQQAGSGKLRTDLQQGLNARLEGNDFNLLGQVETRTENQNILPGSSINSSSGD